MFFWQKFHLLLKTLFFLKILLLLKLIFFSYILAFLEIVEAWILGEEKLNSIFKDLFCLQIWTFGQYFFLKRLFKIYSTQSLFCLICKWKPMIKIWISQAISDQSLKFWTFWISTRSQVSGTPIDLIPKCFSRLEIVNQKAYS